jgi:hypothetical protein
MSTTIKKVIKKKTIVKSPVKSIFTNYTTTNINDLELVYSLLQERHPDQQIEIEYNDNTKEYKLNVTTEPFVDNPEIPLELKTKVIYGDSCTGDTPLLLQKDGQVYIETIKSIFDETKKVEYPGFKMFDQSIRLEKEYSLTDYKVWTDIGWVNIKKVIRHKCEKKIYRVLTHTGCVDITEDHSLIKENKEPIKPGELQVGDTLLHSFPTEFVENKNCLVKMEKVFNETKVCNTCKIEKDINEFYKRLNKKINKCKDCDYYKNSEHPLRNIMKNFEFKNYNLTEKEAEAWGFFQGDGSCGTYKCKSGIKNSWALNNQDLKRLNYFKDILESVEPVKFKILDTLKSSGVYKLVPVGSLKYMVEKYRPLFYYQKDCNAEGDKYKIVPNCILNASKEIKKAYWRGYYEADGAKTSGKNVNNPSFAVKGKIGSQCMYYLMRSIGYDIGINITSHPKKKEIYFLSKTNFSQKKEINIKKIIEKEITNDYVYDLETDIGRFGAGVGQLEIFNTDSIFISFKYNRDNFEKNRQDTFKLATICGDNITNLFNRNPICLEFEKVFQPFILLTKKRYIGKKFEDTSDPFKLKTTTTAGIAVTRRDFANFTKKCYKEIIDLIMENKANALEDACELFKKYIDKLTNYQIDLQDIVISAQIGKEYSCKTCKKKVEWVLKCEKCKTLNPKMNKICQGSLRGKPCKKEFECVHTFSLGHINLAQRQLFRNEEVQVGDRIQYIFVESENTNAQKNELAEDPVYAEKNALKFNRGCYLEQLGKTLLAFFKITLAQRQDLLDDIIEYTNTHLIKFGNKKLKASDYKIDDE